MNSIQMFDCEAARYDTWFDTEPGMTLFASEVRALRRLNTGLPRPWLEVGVGTGRFAAALGIDMGIDPAAAVLRSAKQRRVTVLRASGCALPFQRGTFGAVFAILTHCFVEDAARLLREVARVTRPYGGVQLGIVPLESPRGRRYAAKGEAGHIFYSKARFLALRDARRLAGETGLRFEQSVSTLFATPDEQPLNADRPRRGESGLAGFVAMRFRPRQHRMEEVEVRSRRPDSTATNRYRPPDKRGDS